MPTNFRSHRLAYRIPLVCGVLLIFAAACTAGEDYFDPAVMMDTHEIRPGMRAVGKSVFQGTEITTFNLEIVDVMPKANSGGDLIMARLLDGPIVERQAGVAGGMSGSPIYVDGRLIGAIAYTSAFNKEPACGITAIRDMLGALDMMDGTAEKQALGPPERRWEASRPFMLGGQKYRAAQVVRPGERTDAHTLALYEVGPALSCTGIGGEALAMLREYFAPYAMEPVMGGGSGINRPSPKLEPGAAVGVRLMQGDFDMTGIGTVTWREGERLLAFGHSMFNMGPVNLPLTTAWIHDFQPSYYFTNKIGSGLENVGTLQADIPWSVGGTVGQIAPMVPINVEINDLARERTHRFNMEVAALPGITPILMAIGVASSLEAAYSPGNEGMISINYVVKGTRGARIERSDDYYFSGNPSRAGVAELLEVMSILENNRWEPQEIAEVTYSASISSREERTFIERVYAEETVAKAGEPLHLHVLLRPDDGPVEDHLVTINMPIEMPKGTVRIGIGGGQDAQFLRRRLGLLLPTYDDLDSLIQLIENIEGNRELCVIVALPNKGLAVGETHLMQLPRSIDQILRRAPRTDMYEGQAEMLLQTTMPHVVEGRAIVSLVAQDRQGARGAMPQLPTPTTPTPAPTPEPTPQQGSESAAAMPLQRLWWAGGAFGEPIVAGTPVVGISPPLQQSIPSPLRNAGEANNGDDENETAVNGENDREDTTDNGPPPATVIRRPSEWSESTVAEFERGETAGVGIRSDGAVALVPEVAEPGSVDEFSIWGMAAGEHGIFVTTGDRSAVYRLGEDRAPQKIFSTREFALGAPVLDSEGMLYAAAWPGGRIYRISPDGTGEVAYTLPCEYIWALAFAADGTLWAGTGPQGRLYAVSPAGEVRLVHTLPQAHILSLLPWDDGLYLGTAEKGLVYHLTPDNRLEVVLHAGETDVTSLARDDHGRLYAATSPNGKIYRIEPDQPPLVLFEKSDMHINKIVYADGMLYAATGPNGRLLGVVDEQQNEIIHESDSTHLVSLVVALDGTVLAGAANPGTILHFAPSAAAEGTFTSAVFDAARPARWGVVSWQASVGDNGRLEVQTRSGNSDNPDDDSWSTWSRVYTLSGKDRVDSPPARFLQYRVRMEKTDGALAPVLHRMNISYLPANRPPTVSFTAPKAGEVISGNTEVKWQATDPDRDSLTAVVEYAPAGGEKWRILQELGPGKSTWEWPTRDVADGLYDLRVTVSDAVSNPQDALSASAVQRGVRVDNQRPRLMITAMEVEDEMLVVEGVALDNHAVAEVAYRTNTDWHAAHPLNGMFASPAEQFRFAVPLRRGAISIEVRVRDAAGNIELETIQWPLPPKDDKQRERN